MTTLADLEREYKPYRELSNAIILQAVKDYKSNSSRYINDAINFFKSEWFTLLTDIDPVSMMNRINETL